MLSPKSRQTRLFVELDAENLKLTPSILLRIASQQMLESLPILRMKLDTIKHFAWSLKQLNETSVDHFDGAILSNLNLNPTFKPLLSTNTVDR
jgi:hypothetical protein